MRVETIRRYASKLPENDFHPYRTGAWAPGDTEYDAFGLDVIAGEVPRDLGGVYLRNTENPLFEAIGGRYHPFDGDGMVHAVSFHDGTADYRNRFVKTAGLAAELEAGRALFAGILESPDLSEREGWGARPRMKDASSTDVLVHAGHALTTFYQCGEAYRMDPRTLEPRGIAPLHHASFPRGATISAHAKVDPRTGELLFFNYGPEAPYAHVGVADREGALVRAIPVPLPGPRLPHDIAFTPRFVVMNDFPYFWDPAKLEKNVYRAKYDPEIGSRFGLVPRSGEGEVRWFSAAPTYVLHFANAYEDGDVVVLEGYRQEEPVPAKKEGDNAISLFMKSLDMHSLRTHLHRWRFDLRTGETHEESLDDEVSEFPAIDGRRAGLRARYVYAAIGEPGFFLFSGLCKTDLETGAKATYTFPKGVFASEVAFAPREGSQGEDDGYLVTLTTDAAEGASECQVFHAQDVARGPIARLRLPARIASGTHASWASHEALEVAR